MQKAESVVDSLTASELAERTLHRRAVEAGIWGMAAVNYDLMLQEMLTKTVGKVNQVIYWGRPLNWHNLTLTPNPDTLPSQAAQSPTPAPSSTSPGDRRFPQGFYWGVATSAYQIEGAANEDGKGKSIWDTYAHTPGKIRDGSNGHVANDHYRRYKEDVALMKDINPTAYRFSIAWPRIFPEGTGQPNQKGLGFYSRLVDELKAAGIEPFATLYHWDLPQALQDKHKGWQSRDTAKAFADYAGYMAENLSDRVKHFFTINEFYSFCDMGHRGEELAIGGKTVRIELAPGLKLPPAGLNQVRFHAVRAHGLAVQAIRARGRAGTKCGPAEKSLWPCP